jgi:hypothetical protein
LAGSSSHFLSSLLLAPLLSLSPKNTEQDTNTLPPEFKKNLTPVLEGVHLIVIGYGGYDTGIMDYLRETTSSRCLGLLD